MSTKLGEFTIKLYENDSLFIDLPDDEFLSVAMFAYYVDRIVHNLSEEKYQTLITGLSSTSEEFLDSLRNSIKPDGEVDLSKLVGKAHFGHGKPSENLSGASFEAKGEYFKKDDDFFYLQTQFKPTFAPNDLLEKMAVGSLVAYFDYLLLNLSNLRTVYLMVLIKVMTGQYLESLEEGALPQINEVPVSGLNAASNYVGAK